MKKRADQWRAARRKPGLATGEKMLKGVLRAFDTGGKHIGIHMKPVHIQEKSNKG